MKDTKRMNFNTKRKIVVKPDYTTKYVKDRNTIELKQVVKVLHFYLWSKNHGEIYLFTDPYSKGLFEYFKDGRSEKEIIHYSSWDKNPRLDKTISKIPKYIKYLLNEDNADKERKYKMIQLSIPTLALS